MEIKSMPEEVAERLGFYVYRLIDPRNGDTFYVGKGSGDRVLQHVKAAVRDDFGSEKTGLIREIIAANLSVGHVIHRHGMDEETAMEVEAAVMDCFPSARNKLRGHRSAKRGRAHLRELIDRYGAEEFAVERPLLLISVGRYEPSGNKSLLDQVRGCWKITHDYAKPAQLVLAHQRGIVRGVFVPRQWVPATKENFDWLDEDEPGRIGFIGEGAPKEVADLYMSKRVPQRFRKKGAAFPVRKLLPGSEAAEDPGDVTVEDTVEDKPGGKVEKADGEVARAPSPPMSI